MAQDAKRGRGFTQRAPKRSWLEVQEKQLLAQVEPHWMLFASNHYGLADSVARRAKEAGCKAVHLYVRYGDENQVERVFVDCSPERFAIFVDGAHQWLAQYDPSRGF